MRENIFIKVEELAAATAAALIVPVNGNLVLPMEGLIGSIRSKGGMEIQRELNEIGRMELGEAVVTGAGKLKATILIHTVCVPDPRQELTEEILVAALRQAFARACERGIKSVALPPIGMEGAGFPVKRCAELLLSEAIKHLEGDTPVEEITFCLPNQRVFAIFDECMRQV